MHISDYIKNNTQQQRQQHIDLTEDCIFAVAKQTNQYTKKGDPVKASAAGKTAMNNLLSYLNLTGKTNRFIHTCHKCKNDSGSNNICVNPKHLYFGTPSENEMDKPEELRKKNAINAAKKVKNHSGFSQKAIVAGGVASSKSPKGNINKVQQCQNCNRIIKGPAYYGHIKVCGKKE